MFTTTANGALTHATTTDGRVDFFFSTVRGISYDQIGLLLESALRESELDTMKLVFHLRDCRGGKGERQAFYDCIKYLMATNRQHLIEKNFTHIPHYGYWKDIWAFADTEMANQAVKTYAEALRTDLTADAPSLAVKYAPREGSALDKKHGLVKKLSKQLKVSPAGYRTKIIRPLAAKVKVVESRMCAKQWTDINYSAVPSVAGKKYRKAFSLQDTVRYNQFLQAVNSGEAKMNVGQLQPHQIVQEVILGEDSEAINTMWSQYLKHCEQLGTFDRVLSIVDVSGSMSGGYRSSVAPINVAIALGLITAHCTKGQFHNKWLTFSDDSRLETIKEGTLSEQVKAMSQGHWDMNTNFQRAFETILDIYLTFGVPVENQIQTLFCFSDMQFNVAANGRTNFEEIERKFADHGYRRPAIIFWNLSANKVTFPVTTKAKDVALLSGFSPDLLKLVVDGDDLTPVGVMRRAIDDERYDRITV